MAETKTWKQSVGAFLTAKGAIIGSALVVAGSILEGSINWIDGLINIIRTFFGA